MASRLRRMMVDSLNKEIYAFVPVVAPAIPVETQGNEEHRARETQAGREPCIAIQDSLLAISNRPH